MSRPPHKILVTVGSGIRYDGSEMGVADNLYNRLRAAGGNEPVRLSVDGTHRRGPQPDSPKPAAKAKKPAEAAD